MALAASTAQALKSTSMKVAKTAQAAKVQRLITQHLSNVRHQRLTYHSQTIHYRPTLLLLLALTEQ